MAKPTFAKMGLTKNTEVKTFTYKEQEIEVKQYLPIEEKLELIGNAVNNTLLTDDNNFPNYIKLRMYVELEVIFKYTNIIFTDKQKEDLPKLYDLLAGNGIVDLVEDQLPQNTIIHLIIDAQDILEEIFNYNNSTYMAITKLIANYANTDEELADTQNKLKSLDNLDLVKDIVTKLG